MDKLGVGVIGCGGMGLGHARRLLRQEHATLVAVADVRQEAAARAGDELGVPADLDYESLLARPDVQAVVVATPNHTHRPVTLAAAAAGKHVFCEKPMARTVRECDEMIAAAESAGVKLLVGQVLRLMPPFVRVREMVASGELGRPVMVETCRLGWPAYAEPWRRQRDLVWGMLYESNVHELDFMRAVCGEAAEVQAAVDTLARKDFEYEDTALVTIRFQSGALGLLRASYCSAVPATDGRIMCEKGAIAYDWAKRRIEYRLVGQEESTVLELDAGQFEDAFSWEQRSFVEWVLFDRPPVVTAWDGRAAIELCEAAYLSAERRAPVRLPL